MSTELMTKLCKLIGAYGLDCHLTGELAPTIEMSDAIKAVDAELAALRVRVEVAERAAVRTVAEAGVVYINVSGLTGSGKSAICGEIEILCNALGVLCQWVGGQQEKNLTHADWTSALEMYQPRVVITETNIPRAIDAALSGDGRVG